jgi:transposase InsO family protein
MRVFGLERGILRCAGLDLVELTPKEIDRLRALELWRETGDVALVARTFGLSRATLYRWRSRFDPADFSSLKDRSRRPRRLRRADWPSSLLSALLRLRQRYPRWGKRKLRVLLAQRGFEVSEATVGRILASLRRRGMLREPTPKAISARRRQRARPYATRKPRDFLPRRPGDLLEVDTLDIRPLPGVVLKQFTATDRVSRWNVIEVHQRATSSLAAKFLTTLLSRMPFSVRAIQVDGGSEFCSDFEWECQRRGIRLFVLPPKSPKLNGSVERAQRSHTEEFYEVEEIPWTVEGLTLELLRWEKTYNTVRPHQALGYLTPLQFLQQQGIIPKQNPSLSHMY